MHLREHLGVPGNTPGRAAPIAPGSASGSAPESAPRITPRNAPESAPESAPRIAPEIGAGELPLEAFLLLALLADLGELPLVVLPRPALLGLPSRVVLHPLHLLLPGLHQLVVALADVLLLSAAKHQRGE